MFLGSLRGKGTVIKDSSELVKPPRSLFAWVAQEEEEEWIRRRECTHAEEEKENHALHGGKTNRKRILYARMTNSSTPRLHAQEKT